MAEGRFGSLYLTIRTQNLSICAVEEKENLQLKDNLVPKITKFSKVTAADLSLPGRAGCTLWPTVASEGSWLRCSVALSHQSILLVLAVVVKLAPVFLYSFFSVCHKRRGKSFVVIAYLSTSLLYLLVTQGNEHFGSFLLCEESFLTVERLSDSSRGSPTPWWGLTFF